jgi:uncharacterized membrane protein
VDGVAHGFRYNGSAYTTIDAPGASETLAFGVNSSGEIVGYYSAGSVDHGFVFDGIAFTPLDVEGATSTRAFGINDSGLIVGSYDIAGGPHHGFTYDGNRFGYFDCPGSDSTELHAVNSAGQMVGMTNPGSHAFLREDASCTSIDFPGATFNDAEGINDAGEIVGLVGFSGVSWPDGFARIGNDSYRRITFPLSQDSQAWKVNNDGQIVGSYKAKGGAVHGFLLTPGS